MIACYECSGSGFKHGCIDDYCRNSIEPEDCRNAIVCPVCKGDGDGFEEEDGYEGL